MNKQIGPHANLIHGLAEVEIMTGAKGRCTKGELIETNQWGGEWRKVRVTSLYYDRGGFVYAIENDGGAWGWGETSKFRNFNLISGELHEHSSASRPSF